LSSIGRYIPKANARPDTPHSSVATANTPPMPYRNHGAPLVPITPRSTAAIALGCGAGSGCRWPGPGEKPYTFAIRMMTAVVATEATTAPRRFEISMRRGVAPSQ
jgi:hypothetical protein